MKNHTMYKSCIKLRSFIFILLITSSLYSQDAPLPPDLRQHNLTQFNSSLFNPVFSLDRNDPQSLSVWSRWQWQQLDADPTSVFVNYTHQLNNNSAFGLGFLQHNTGVFLQTGGVLNYAYKLQVSNDLYIALALNIHAFQNEIADDRFQQGPGSGLPSLDNGPSFVLQGTPSILLGIDNFRLGFVSENVLGYNVTTGEETDAYGKLNFIGHASYAFPIMGSGLFEGGNLEPMMYLKSLPDLDTQYGFNTLYTTNKLWFQAGYHNFYGVSGGIGGTFFQKFSIGALIEFGLNSELDGKEPTFEIISSYKFAKPDLREKVVGFEIEDEVEMKQIDPDLPIESATEAKKEKKPKRLSKKERKALAQANEERKRDSVLRIQQIRDSVALAESKIKAKAEELRLKELQRKQDSVAAKLAEQQKEVLAKPKPISPEKGERFEEAVVADEIAPGFYLIVNVFGTQKYFNSFKKSLTDKGLKPQSFYRSQNKLNYVYLQRYDTMQEARAARDSKFGGKYTDTIWIFRVIRE